MASGNRKDPTLAAVLGALFGCFGLIYVSFKDAAIAFVVLFSIGFCTGGVGFLGWFLCGFYGYVAAENHNKQLAMAQPPDHALPNDQYQQDPYNDWSSQASDQRMHEPAYQPNHSGSPMGSQQSAKDPYASFYCTECGTALTETDKFCGGCGTATT